jgi:DMSO/TMAO reductase YedYZ molybdopterin-dependent catalytic subunit
MMKKKLLQTCLFLTIFGLLLITSIGKVSADTLWNLQVTNTSNTTVNYSYDQLLTMPKTTVSSSEYCYGYLVTSGDWEGVSLSYLLKQAGLDPAVASVSFVAQDGYIVSLQLHEALQSDVIIAYQLNGMTLPETLRLVIPEANGNMWIAMITSITMSTSTTQPGIGGGAGIALPSNSVSQSLTQQQEPVQTQHTTPKNEINTEPAAPTTNVTQPAQKAIIPQGSTPGGLNFPVVVVYGIAFGATIALVAATLALVRRRKTHTSLISSRPVLSI